MRASVKFFVSIGAAAALVFAYLAWVYYNRIYSSNVDIAQSKVDFYIHSDWNYDSVRNALNDQKIVKDLEGFDWVARKKNYPNLVKSGRYEVLDAMSNNSLVDLLRSGEQKPIKVIVPSVRTKAELAAKISPSLEMDSISFMNLITNDAFCGKYGFNEQTILTMFLPNTYEFYWNTSAEEFVQRMAKEFKRFWNDERLAKARALGMSQSQVSTLASIVQAEQGMHADERPMVAGLYLNRIKKGMRLESDPTLIHAIGDFTIKRVLNIHKKIESPYNTYVHTGLPPGPILLPEISSIDAVLNPATHNYIFMCAKEDFSGYHHFSSSYRQHVNNANRYRRELNKRRIYK